MGKWNQYNVTKKDGKYYWIHAAYDIQSNSFGEIKFDVEFKDNKGGIAIYKYSGFIRDDRVVFVGSPKNKEQPCFIQVWPHLTNHAAEYHYGICFNQSWDVHETLIPCLISRTPLTNKNKIDDQKLDKLWKKSVSDTNLSLLPRIFN